MLTLMGLNFPDNPVRDRLEAPKRAAKLKALEAFFHTSPAQAFYMLDDDALSTRNPDRGKILVVNSHGSPSRFARYTPTQFLDQLVSKGYEKGSFGAIYLMACKSAHSPEDTGVMTNFAIELKRLLIMRDMDCKVYGTRGNLSYKLQEHQVAGGMHYYSVTSMYIKSPSDNPTIKGHTYSVEDGLLLAQAA